MTRSPRFVMAIAALLLIPSVFVPRGAAADRPKNITFDHIKFEIKKGDAFERSMLTPNIEALHGQTVKVRGWMLPAFHSKGLKNFVLVRCNNECCFGPGAALYDSIQVHMNEGKSADYTLGPIVVEGVFTIKEYEHGGQIWSVYHLQAVKAK